MHFERRYQPPEASKLTEQFNQHFSDAYRKWRTGTDGIIQLKTDAFPNPTEVIGLDPKPSSGLYDIRFLLFRPAVGQDGFGRSLFPDKLDDEVSACYCAAKLVFFECGDYRPIAELSGNEVGLSLCYALYPNGIAISENGVMEDENKIALAVELSKFDVSPRLPQWVII